MNMIKMHRVKIPELTTKKRPYVGFNKIDILNISIQSLKIKILSPDGIDSQHHLRAQLEDRFKHLIESMIQRNKGA